MQTSLQFIYYFFFFDFQTTDPIRFDNFIYTKFIYFRVSKCGKKGNVEHFKHFLTDADVFLKSQKFPRKTSLDYNFD